MSLKCCGSFKIRLWLSLRRSVTDRRHLSWRAPRWHQTWLDRVPWGCAAALQLALLQHGLDVKRLGGVTAAVYTAASCFNDCICAGTSQTGTMSNPAARNTSSGASSSTALKYVALSPSSPCTIAVNQLQSSRACPTHPVAAAITPPAPAPPQRELAFKSADKQALRSAQPSSSPIGSSPQHN